MKAILSKIYNILSDCESIIFNAIYEIFSAIALLLFFPFKFLWKVLKPSESFNSNKNIELKEQPIKLFLLYVKDITSKLASPLNGSSIEDSADLIDFKYTRWCIFIYLVMASTYWFYEIGIPNIESPKKDFEQLMSHDALVKLTVVFGATMGLIALLHRSIVSDYQIKQQNKSEKISNYYKISDHIIEHARSIMSLPNSELTTSETFPFGLIDSIFNDPKSGDLSISKELLEILEMINREIPTSSKRTIIRRIHASDNIFINMQNNISLCISLFLCLGENKQTLVKFHSREPQAIRFIFHMIPTLDARLSSILKFNNSVYKNELSEFSIYDKNKLKLGGLDIINSKYKALEKLILTIPLDHEITDSFNEELSNFNQLISDINLEASRSITKEFGEKYECDEYYETYKLLIYIYSCMLLNVDIEIAHSYRFREDLTDRILNSTSMLDDHKNHLLSIIKKHTPLF
jgi:hypothetical protein